jgi:hypothetical protein
MKSYLSGNPEIRVALNEDLSISQAGENRWGEHFFSKRLIIA